MSLTKVQSALKRYIEIPDNRTESGKMLLIAIVEHLKEIGEKEATSPSSENFLIPHVEPIMLPELPEEKAIYLAEFVEEYRIPSEGKMRPISSTGAIINCFQLDSTLAKLAAQRDPQGKMLWKVKPLRFIHYVSKSKEFPKIRKKCQLWIDTNQTIKEAYGSSKLLHFRESLSPSNGA